MTKQEKQDWAGVHIIFVQCRNVGLNSILEKSRPLMIILLTLYENHFSLRLLLRAVNVELFNHLEYRWIINSRNSVVTSDNFRKMRKLLNLRSGWNLPPFGHSPPLKQGGILLYLCVLALACYLMISEWIRLANDSKWNENRNYEGNVLIYFIIFRVGS